MKSRWINNIILFLIASGIGLGICEIVARLITKTDAEDQVYYGKRPLLPYQFPDKMVRRKMDHYFQKKSEAYVIDDPLLGWTVGPDRTNVEGMYRSNSNGIRSRPNEYSPDPGDGVLRIAIFGDSFTHGDEEPFNETWGKFLEDDLREAGISAEVLNFGVPGYGVGQAYLRWKYVGRLYSPRIAVFGFQPENIKRTVNIFRSLYSRETWLVFSKPRFYINQEDELELVNSPVVPPEKVGDVLENFTESPLARYEYWYNPENYQRPFWSRSRLLSLIYTFLRGYQPSPGGRSDYRGGGNYWDVEGEPMRTSQRIIEKFARDVRQAGEIPIILHIPKTNDLKCLARGATPAHYKVLRDLADSGVTVVDPAPEMKGKNRLYKRSHYSSRGGRIVARALSDAIKIILAREDKLTSYKGPLPSYNIKKPDEILVDKYRNQEKILIDLGSSEDWSFIKEGFHDREKHLGKIPVRWTGQTAVIRLPLFPAPGKKPVLNIRVVDTGPAREGGEAGAIIKLGDRRIAHLPLKKGINTVHLELPSDLEEGGVAELTIYSFPWKPRVIFGSGDSRELGIMLDRVTLSYQ